MVEAELYEAGPPNDQTRTVKIELLIKTSNKDYTCSTSAGSDSLGRWCYNWDSHWSPNQLPLPQPNCLSFLFPFTTSGKAGGIMLVLHKKSLGITFPLIRVL